MNEKIKQLGNISAVLHDCMRRLDGILNLTTLSYNLKDDEDARLDAALKNITSVVKEVDKRLKMEKTADRKSGKKMRKMTR